MFVLCLLLGFGVAASRSPFAVNDQPTQTLVRVSDSKPQPKSSAVDKRHSKKHEADRLTQQGRTFSKAGEKEKALAAYKQALSIWQELGEQPQEADVLDSIGLLFNDLGAQSQALDSLEAALRIVQERKEKLSEAKTLNNIGIVYATAGERTKALNYFQQALAIKRKLHDLGDQAATLDNIGFLYAEGGEHEKALEAYHEALSIQSTRITETEVLNNMGWSYAAVGNNDGALRCYERALKQSHSIGDPLLEADVADNLMQFWGQQNPELAIVFGKRSVNLYQSVRSKLAGLESYLQTGFLRSKERSYRQLAELMIAAGRLAEAEHVLDLLKDEEYFNFIRGDEAVARTAPVAFGERDAQALSKIQQEEKALAAKEKLSPLEKQRKALLSTQLQLAAEAAEEFFDRTGEVRAKYDEDTARLIARDERQEAIALQKDLPAMTVAIYTLVGEQGVYSLLISPTLQVRSYYPIAVQELRNKVFLLRAALRDPAKDPLPLARNLYEVIMKGLDQELAALAPQTVLWSLDDVLRYLPMSALNDGHQYLAERFQNVVYNKASSRTGGSFEQWRALGAGVSGAHDALPSLPNVRDELDAIISDPSRADAHGVMPGKILLDSQFTANAFRAALHQDYPVVHIASHFVFRPGNDAASYLLLGDGKLTVAELRRNQDFAFPGVQLLTLSACDTAMSDAGDGHEVDGLGFVAEEKGARAVLATLWEVDDQSTARFMQTFYRELSKGSGITKAQALQKAELALLHNRASEANDGSERGFAHPYFWAPFILIGNGN